ncbi:MAG: endonuclease/exonuclease/phosphatase family protein, partial [Pseudomonadota bacterium]
LRVRPDVLVLNELDADPEGRALALFQALLARGTAEVPGLDYPETFQGPQNVGHFSGLDLDGDGRAAGPGDAWGFGRFPGQYAMALLSRWPLGSVRSFTDFPWAALPGARRPLYPDGTPFHPEAVWQRLRLSSKSHWIAPVHLPGADEPLHLIAAHPTPPVFDGPEDRNGRRNADEIRLIRAILDDAPWLIDDAGGRGGLARDALTAVAGDLNADPHDGDGHRDEINALLSHPRLIDPAPESPGAAEISERTPKQGPRARHTADWPDGPAKPGNLRVDYLLPGRSFEVLGAGVFWPARTDPLAHLVAMRPRPVSSDHRLVWADVRLRR